MSKEYGYIGKEVTQAFRDNKGIFTPQDIIELDQENKWTNFGQLELIETQNVTGTPTTINFTSIKQNIFRVHFLTYNNVQGSSTTAQDLGARVSNDGGSTYESSNYAHANQNGQTDGTFSENRSTSTDRFMLAPDLDDETNASVNGYVYFFNLGDSTLKTTIVDMNFLFQSAVGGRFRIGSAEYSQLEEINALQLMAHSGGGFSAGNFSLYGIRSF